MTATPSPDIIEQIPDPATLDRMLADSIRRTDLLRALTRVARRKAAYRQTSVDRPPATTSSADRGEVTRA